MSLRTTLLVACAVLAFTASLKAETGEPPAAPSPAAPAAEPAEALRAAGLDDLAPSAPVALELSQIPARPAAATEAAAAEPATIDLGALWYFASQKDFGRVAAEIKLIRRTHPDWVPPQDLFSAADGGGPEEQPLWDLFAKQDFDTLHARMDDLKRERPGWAPSANLQGKLALAEARAALMKASDAQDWPGVVTIATANKMLLTCKDLGSLWRTAEALGRSGDQNRAVETYRFTLATCTAPHDRLATVQKASAVLQTTADFDRLLELGRRQPDGSGEFDAMRFDRFRREIGEASADRTLPAPPQADLDALASLAKAPGGVSDAQLLGWYSYARKDYPAAKSWFRQAMSGGPNPKAAEGLVLSIRTGEGLDAARPTALEMAPLGTDNRKLMVDIMSALLIDPAGPAIPADQLATFSQAVDDLKAQDGARALAFYADGKKNKKAAAEWGAKAIRWKGDEIDATRSGDGAVALGWELFKSNDFAGADTWFRKAADWQPGESAAIGLVITAHRLHHMSDFAARLAQFGATYPGVAALRIPQTEQPKRLAATGAARGHKSAARGAAPGRDWDGSADAIIKTFHAGNYGQAVALLDQRRSKRAEPRGLTVVRGWALYHAGDWEGARQVFSSLDGGRYSDERATGLKTIDLGYTNPRLR